MSALFDQSDQPVLTHDGRQRISQTLAGVADEIATIDALVKTGAAGPEDLVRRQRLADQADDLRRVLDRAVDVGAVDEDPSVVEVGDEVDVRHDDGSSETYAIVHPAEADADRNRISAVSPLGEALLGARVGQRVTVAAPAGTYDCTVDARRRLA